jgi:hypothetical protein
MGYIVKHNMKVGGVNIGEGGGLGALGRRWQRCWEWDLIGDGLWYCCKCFSVKFGQYCAVAKL